MIVGNETPSRPRSFDPVVRCRVLLRRGLIHDALAAATEGLAGPAPQDATGTVTVNPIERGRLLLARGELLGLLGDDRAADLEFAEAATLARVDDPATAIRAILMRSAIARFDGRFADADSFVADARSLGSRPPGPGPLVRAAILLEAGLGHLDQDHRRATAELDEAVAVADAVSPGSTRDGVLAQALEGRATAHRVAGEFAAASADLDRALPLARRAFGRSSMEVAQLLNSRGMLGKFAGLFGRAATDYRRAAQIIEDRVGPDNPEMAAVLHNVAGLAHARGLFAEAESPARRSLELRVRAFGGDHLAVALDRAGLAAILDRIGRRDEAEAMLLAALPVIRRTLGPDHREVAVSLNNLAAIAQARGNLDVAERRYREALAIKAMTLGSDSPSVAITLSNLSVVVRRRGDPTEAAALADRAIAILRRTVDEGHPALRAAETNRARIGDHRGSRTGAGAPDVAIATGPGSGRRRQARRSDETIARSSHPLEEPPAMAELADPMEPSGAHVPTDAEPDTEGHRLASNDSETIATDDAEPDTEGHRLAANDSETIVTEDAEPDTEGHRLAVNDSETIVTEDAD